MSSLVLRLMSCLRRSACRICTSFRSSPSPSSVASCVLREASRQSYTGMQDHASIHSRARVHRRQAGVRRNLTTKRLERLLLTAVGSLRRRAPEPGLSPLAMTPLRRRTSEATVTGRANSDRPPLAFGNVCVCNMRNVDVFGIDAIDRHVVRSTCWLLLFPRWFSVQVRCYVKVSRASHDISMYMYIYGIPPGTYPLICNSLSFYVGCGPGERGCLKSTENYEQTNKWRPGSALGFDPAGLGFRSSDSAKLLCWLRSWGEGVP